MDAKIGLVAIIVLVFFSTSLAQTPQGYELWLGYSKVENQEKLAVLQQASFYVESGSEMLESAQKEIETALTRMSGTAPSFLNEPSMATVIVAKKSTLDKSILKAMSSQIDQIGKQGFVIESITIKRRNLVVISANDNQGILYGTFRYLQLVQSQSKITEFSLYDSPKIDLRMLNHWDNLDRTVERGFAGFSLWNWQKLPGFIDQRYIDYARANASVGINGTVLTNVNANALVLTPMYLEKVAALAKVFRAYGIKVYLTARFSAPIEIGGLTTADPLDEEVQNWWKEKAKEIYKYVPDFGGFLVKANSEGQPGPQNYGRTHVDGANMMAEALAPFDGVVVWRAFVYSEHDVDDRAKQAYSEFVPYDGQFLDNVLIQTKNGPVDFQPREPFHPMFGAMPKTPLMMEFQITQEYLGFSSHLVFLPKLYEEVLQSDTHVKGKGSTVSKVIDGSLHGNSISGMAGVSNIGNDLNWTGHPFAQANWYGFGRLAWNPTLTAEQIAEEWLQLTYSSNPDFVSMLKPMLMMSREAVVNYMMPLGLHHLFDTNHHYGPGPWVSELGRPEWNPTYYHKADENGIGFDRTPNGSNATNQYADAYSTIMNDPKTCPKEYLLWYHHLPWDYQLENDLILWDAIALQYQAGVDQVVTMQTTWEGARGYVTEQQYIEVKMLLDIQFQEAKWWRDACLLYFQTFSHMEFPEGVDQPEHTLKYYQSLKFPFAPGIRPHWD
ncbi:MAG: alpha-glucuronidase [Reichenbachiella sp.]